MLRVSDIDREQGRRSLARFVRIAWPMVEPSPLRWNWHMDAVCSHLEAVTSGQIRDLVICVPPGTSKSLIVSTFWPAWDWIQRPTRRFLTATYAQDLSEKNAKMHRDLIMDPWFQARWPEVAIGKDDVAKVRQFHNTSKGSRVSTSVGGTTLGRHSDIHIGDDLVNSQRIGNYVDPLEIHKANEFWFKTMFTRRADAATTARVMVAQRLHHEDTPGKCIEKGYTALVLPMQFDPTRPCRTTVGWTGGARFEDPRKAKGELLDPSRFPAEVVEGDRSTLGALGFEAQMQQNPTPDSGVVFVDAGKRWTEIPRKNSVTIITVDATFKDKKSSDFVAIHAWTHQGKSFYMEPVREHGRMGITATIEAVQRMHAAYPNAAIWIEDKANGSAIIEILQSEISGVKAFEPGSDSKEGRARAMAHLMSDTYFPPDDQAPWVGEVITTVRRFPLVKFDDDVDAMVMALRILYQPKRTTWLEAVKQMGRRG